jgi:hypothetical protein
MPKISVCSVTRTTTHQANYGSRPIVTKVSVSIEGQDDDDSYKSPAIELEVSYAGQPRHQVGQQFVGLSEAIFRLMGM